MLQTGYNATRAPSVDVFNETLKAFKDTKPDEYASINTDVEFWSDHAKPVERLEIGGVASSNLAERSVHFTEEEVSWPLLLNDFHAMRAWYRLRKLCVLHIPLCLLKCY